MRQKQGNATALVIFGSSGDLANSRLLPAVHSLKRQGWLPNSTQIVGIDRRRPEKPPSAPNFSFIRGDLRNQETYDTLARRLGEVGGPADANCLFYLATKPQLFREIVKRLKEAGLNRSDAAWRKIVVEKPFGTDRKSAGELEKQLDSAFDQNQVYRMDHFLGKEAVQGMIPFRFANSAFEPIWNNEHVDHVQIMADENLGLEGRTGFYEGIGVMRDMVQNHLLQLLCLLAMEPPPSYDADSLGESKAGVLKAVRHPSMEDSVWGQYKGYRNTNGVTGHSKTPTFVALKLYVDNARWRGVPFYLRTGRMMARNATEIVVLLKTPRLVLKENRNARPNWIRFCIDPDEGIRLGLQAKTPGSGMNTSPVEMTFRYRRFKQEEYSRLLQDAMLGDQTLFVGRDFNDLAWRVFDPLLNQWEHGPDGHLYFYDAGSWGPKEADELLAAEGRSWQQGCSA